MRSYGDKPAEFLRLVPGGLLPAILIDNKRVQTESLEIMLNLDSMFTGPPHISMWPAEGTEENIRAKLLMKLERQLFGAWCNLVFRPPGEREQKQFEICMDEVEKQLKVTAGPFFLSTFSIVDLTYITHVERMAASIAYWTGFLVDSSRTHVLCVSLNLLITLCASSINRYGETDAGQPLNIG